MPGPRDSAPCRGAWGSTRGCHVAPRSEPLDLPAPAHELAELPRRRRADTPPTARFAPTMAARVRTAIAAASAGGASSSRAAQAASDQYTPVPMGSPGVSCPNVSTATSTAPPPGPPPAPAARRGWTFEAVATIDSSRLGGSWMHSGFWRGERRAPHGERARRLRDARRRRAPDPPALARHPEEGGATKKTEALVLPVADVASVGALLAGHRRATP